MTTTSYELSKKLAKFLGPSRPTPLRKYYWNNGFGVATTIYIVYLRGEKNDGVIPAYTLEDLLSKPFCEAIGKLVEPGYAAIRTIQIRDLIVAKYYDGGFPAVEKALWEMMGGKQ